jgi:Lrp/AsnC family leucine-responsive transcriptional regulator
MSSMKGREPSIAPLDAVDRRLVLALSGSGREAASGLARKLGLSRQAVAERLRELERRGVIRGYRADVDPAALGLVVRAQIRITLDGAAPAGREREVLRRLQANPHVRSVYRVSGEDCLLVFVVCRSIADVNSLLASLRATRAVQSSRTSFVLEAVLEKAPLGPLEAALLAD